MSDDVMVKWLHYLALFGCFMVVTSKPLVPLGHGELTVSTYNLWNVMFNWDVRKYRISQMIRDVNPDVIAFQEVRSDFWTDRHDGHNQLSELQELLPYHRWKVFVAVQDANEQPGTVNGLGYGVEGVGFLSRHPLLNWTTQHLSESTSSPDKNKRKALHVNVDVPDIGVVHFVVVHLSYDKNQQCSNVVEIAQNLQGAKFPFSIIMGDFNIYQGYEQPLERLLKGHYSSDSGCPKNTLLEYQTDPDKTVLYTDVWKEVNPNHNGFTFSNMPVPGLQSRPDRILVSKNTLAVKSVNIQGDGQTYRDQFQGHIWRNRLHTVINAAYLSYVGVAGRPCNHDCGPHGSCRCGVCVSGGDKRACELPQCSECNSDVYFYMLFITVIFLIFFIQFFYAVLQVLFILNKKNEQLVQSMGINCCLFYPGLYSESGNMHRSSWRLFRLIAKLWPFCRMPALVQIISSVAIMIFIEVYATYMFSDVVHTVDAIMPEEMFPSDHRMLTAHLVSQPDGPIIHMMP